MSLDDKFYPEDRDYLTRFDNAMIKVAGKVGEAYQHVTGKSYDDLIKKSYLSATAVSGTALICPVVLPITLQNLDLYRNPPKKQSPLEEEIISEAKGEDRRVSKVLRMALSTFGLVLMGASAVEVNNIDNFMEFSLYSSAFLTGFSMLPTSFGLYLSKADIPKPPEKRVHERALDKIRELLEPKPIPVDTYSPLGVSII